MRKKVGAVVLASMALLGFASPAFGDNVNALGGSPAGGGADAPSTVKPIVLADLDADPDRIRDLVIAELPESPEGGGADAPSTVKPIVLADLDATRTGSATW